MDGCVDTEIWNSLRMVNLSKWVEFAITFLGLFRRDDNSFDAQNSTELHKIIIIIVKGFIDILLGSTVTSSNLETEI